MDEDEKGIQTYFVNSSLTNSVVYNPETQTASFVFTKNGRSTEIEGIDEERMRDWLAAPSFGLYFVENFQVR